MLFFLLLVVAAVAAYFYVKHKSAATITTVETEVKDVVENAKTEAKDLASKL